MFVSAIVRNGATRRLNPGHKAAWLAAALLIPATEALAFLDGQLELSASETLTAESNVFRISRDRDASTFIGSSEKGDHYLTTSLGLKLDIPVSRQRIQASLAVNDVRYRRFTDLSFTGYDGKAAWLWALGDRLNGQLGYAESKTLASTLNIAGRTPNLVKTRQVFGNGAYMLAPHWRLDAGASQVNQSNGAASRRENDVEVRSADLAASYLSSTDSRIGLAWRGEEGQYPNRQLVGATLVDNAYTQNAVGIVASWVLTGKSTLNARADVVRRHFDEFQQRNYKGTTFRADYRWQATEKFSLNAIAQKDISATEDIRTSFVLVKGLTLRPRLALTEKVAITGTLDYSTRDYLGDSGITLGTITSARSDRVRLLQAGVEFLPTRAILLQLSAQHESRSSNQPLNDYEDNLLSVSGRIAF